MLEQEFKYYLDHQEELSKKHFSRFIIIKGNQVHGDFSTEIEAVLHAKNTLGFGLGTFLVQQCLPGVESHTQFFHSRVMFLS